MQLQMPPSSRKRLFNLSASDTYKSGQWMWQLTINAVTANYWCCRHQTIHTKKLLLYDVNKFITFIVKFIKRGGGWHQQYLDFPNILSPSCHLRALNNTKMAKMGPKWVSQGLVNCFSLYYLTQNLSSTVYIFFSIHLISCLLPLFWILSSLKKRKWRKEWFLDQPNQNWPQSSCIHSVEKTEILP